MEAEEWEIPKEYVFKENSSYGVLEGQIIVKEK